MMERESVSKMIVWSGAIQALGLGLRAGQPVVLQQQPTVDRCKVQQLELPLRSRLAVGETVILLNPPSPFSRCFNMDGEGM